ncbi:hypothetical protein LDL76_00775 [Salegentibacter mishustinae]|uniref:hypothetical protein n=1 Tax=Salegentibacter mishustinae TaxID=270918 RepID=UPI001CE05CF5|nr:hypothetical protein [Salegentibacter mishustinae]UBZ07260.1 hypothetical protein LDL76_00775 [Salegentibacter mishustinae]
MMKSPNSKKLASFVSNASGKITSVGNKTMEFSTVKKTVASVSTSSKQISSYTTETSKKVVAAGKKTAESEKVKNTVNFLGNSTKEVLSESRKIASNVIFNVSIVALIFLALNSIFIIYGIYGIISNFSWLSLLLVFGILIAGIAFTALAAYRCYTYGQFKIGIGIYHLLEGFFKILISRSIAEIENAGHEKMKKTKITGLLKKNGSNIIQSSVYKMPGIVRKPIFLLMEFIPFGDIIVEVLEESKRNATGKIEDQVMKRLASHVSSLRPHSNFTRFVVFTLLGNIVVMGCLTYWM